MVLDFYKQLLNKDTKTSLPNVAYYQTSLLPSLRSRIINHSHTSKQTTNKSKSSQCLSLTMEERNGKKSRITMSLGKSLFLKSTATRLVNQEVSLDIQRSSMAMHQQILMTFGEMSHWLIIISIQKLATQMPFILEIVWLKLRST